MYGDKLAYFSRQYYTVNYVRLGVYYNYKITNKDMVETTEECKLVIEEARKLALKYKHDAIGFDHFFIGMLNTDCLANEYLKSFDAENWNMEFGKRYTDNGTHSEDDSVAITNEAETILFHANTFAENSNHEAINSIHILLSIINYDNYITEALQKKGIVFEDLAASAFNDSIKKIPSGIELIWTKPYSKFEKFFLSKSEIKKKIDDLYYYAHTYFHYGEYDNCCIACDIGLSLDSAYNPFSILKACSFLHKREFAKAIQYLEVLSAEYPNDNIHLHNLQYSYEENGDYMKSSAVLDTLLERLPNNDVYLNNKGFNFNNLGKYQESIYYYEKAIEYNPTFAYAWDNMGFSKYKLGDTEEGLRLIDYSLELDKGNAYAYRNKGIIFMEQQDHIRAIENFNLALKFGYTKRYGDEVINLLKKIS